MSLIFENIHKCENCLHNNVCKLKEEKDEIISKVLTRADNIVTSTKDFKIILKCSSFLSKGV